MNKRREIRGKKNKRSERSNKGDRYLFKVCRKACVGQLRNGQPSIREKRIRMCDGERGEGA